MTQEEQIRMLEETINLNSIEFTYPIMNRSIPEGVGIMEQLPSRGPVGDSGDVTITSTSSTSAPETFHFYSSAEGFVTIQQGQAGQVQTIGNGIPQWVSIQPEPPQPNEISTPPYSFYTALRMK